MATISNTPRPGYVWDSTDNVWYPIGVGAHQHTNAADTPAVMPYSTYAAAGKNKIINGDFGIWQRGTSFTNPTTGTYTADRYRTSNSTEPTSRTISQQTFTPGAAPVAGYEGNFFLRSTLTTVGSSTAVRVQQRIEDVRTLAGQAVTLSFYAKSDSNRTQTVSMAQNFGSGGSASIDALAPTTFSTTTSWTRFTFSFSAPSVSGKTIGTNSFIEVVIIQALADGSVLDIWGIQVEAGSVATPFQTATGTLAGELAACQRYYWRTTSQASSTDNILPYGSGISTTEVQVSGNFPVRMRTNPTAVEWAGLRTYDGTTFVTVTGITLGTSTLDGYLLSLAGASGMVQYRPTQTRSTSSSPANSYVGFSAEL